MKKLKDVPANKRKIGKKYTYKSIVLLIKNETQTCKGCFFSKNEKYNCIRLFGLTSIGCIDGKFIFHKVKK